MECKKNTSKSNEESVLIKLKRQPGNRSKNNNKKRCDPSAMLLSLDSEIKRIACMIITSATCCQAPRQGRGSQFRILTVCHFLCTLKFI